MKYRNVVEFRHESWWNKKVFSEFRKNKIIFCSVGGPKLPEDVVKTASDVYLRFHGTAWYSTNYSDKELSGWKRKVKKVKPRNCWAYFNNDFNAYATKNAASMRKLLKK